MRRITAFTLLSLVTTGTGFLFAQNPPAQPGALSAAGFQQKLATATPHRTASDLYAALKATARPPQLPDWSGIWTSSGFGSLYAPGPSGVAPKLTSAAEAAIKAGRERNAQGLSYDENLSECGPAGFPRWLQEPFLREFAVTPTQTYLINEMVNEIRRIYTDGRGHTPEADRYPLADGDSIGFWDGAKLVIHTNQLMERSMGRNAPVQSDKMEAVEVWERVDPNMIAVDVWLWDPALYLEPWYVQRRYTLVPNADKSLRVRHWDCGENPNNAVVKTKDGSTQFRDLNFTDKDNR